MTIPEALQTTYGRPMRLSQHQQQEAYLYHTEHNVSLRALARFYGCSTTAVKTALLVMQEAVEATEKRQWLVRYD